MRPRSRSEISREYSRNSQKLRKFLDFDPNVWQKSRHTAGTQLKHYLLPHALQSFSQIISELEMKQSGEHINSGKVKRPNDLWLALNFTVAFFSPGFGNLGLTNCKTCFGWGSWNDSECSLKENFLGKAVWLHYTTTRVRQKTRLFSISFLEPSPKQM